MIRRLAIGWLASVTGLAAAGSSDLLRFSNGDQLHGTFQGMKEGPQAVWLREDVSAPVDFKISQLRHIVLQGGQASTPLTSLSHIGLVNGDRLPGTVTALDAESVTLETPYAGSLRIPRAQTAMLAPNPLGGRVYYHGPFVEKEWEMIHASYPDGLPPLPQEPKEKTEAVPGRWIFSGTAWFWQSRLSGTALVKKEAMPDRAILRFDLAWKNRLSIAVGFHTDFARRNEQKDEAAKERDGVPGAARFMPGDSTALPAIFGNGYVLHIFATHLMLYRTSIGADGVASIGRVQVNSNNVRLSDSGSATMEIRSNRLTGQIALFINDEFAAQWSDLGEVVDTPAGSPQNGTGFGFVVQSENSPVKLSDVMVAEWNGMPDSARSLQVDAQDIVLLSNGTDRFSGNVKALENGQILVESKHGSFQFPLEEIAEIRFARNRLAKPVEPAADNVIVRLSPLGQISGRPMSGTASSMRLLHPFAGEIQLNLESAVMLDFQPSNNPIDDWNSDF